MRDILFAVVMLSLPAALAMIAGKTIFSVRALEAELVELDIGPLAAAELYEAKCAECHGGLAEGTAHGPPLVTLPTGTELARQALHTAIRFGVAEPEAGQPAMPPFPELSDAEIRGLIRFVGERRIALAD